LLDSDSLGSVAPQPDLSQALSGQPVPVYLAAGPNAFSLFGDSGGPMTSDVGLPSHTEYTLSQVKRYIMAMLALIGELLRKIGFLERRQQRQNPSLAELSREHSQAWAVSWGECCLWFMEASHSCCMMSSFWGFMCFPCHAFFVCVSCCYWKCKKEDKGEAEELEGINARLEAVEQGIRSWEAEASQQGQADWSQAGGQAKQSEWSKTEKPSAPEKEWSKSTGGKSTHKGQW